MSKQIAERTIKSHTYVIGVWNGFLDFIPRFATLCRWENSMHQWSVLFNWPITNLLRTCWGGLCEGRISLAVLVKVEERNQGKFAAPFTSDWCFRKCCWLLEGKATCTQPIEQQAENRSDYCILGTNYLFSGHAFVARNFKSNHQTFSTEGHGWLGMRLVVTRGM